MTTLYKASNLRIDNTFLKNPNRYYLEEFFNNKPVERANLPGSGIASAVTTKVYNDGVDIVTLININLVGLKSYGNGNVIGITGSTDPGYLTQLTTSKNGHIYNASISCSITPTTGEEQIDLAIKSSSVNVQTGLSGTTIINSSAMVIGSCAIVQSTTGDAPFNGGFVDQYLYIIGGNNTSGEYATGQVIITLRGKNPSSSIVPLASNMSFEVIGTNGIDCSQSAIKPGIELTTGGADNDQLIIRPSINNSSSAWGNNLWGTEDELEYESCIITDSSISDMAFWCGLKLTNTGAYATDADQAYFLYSTNSDLGSLTTNANLHFVYSVGGTDYVTDLGIVVAVSTKYILKINIDSDRKIRIYVNETLYGLATTSVAGGTTQSTTTEKSNALTNNIDLIPYTGIQSLSAAANTITLSYVKISKAI